MTIHAIIGKEFRQIVRDSRTLGVLLVVPLFLLVMFGYAISLDVKNASLAIIDYDHSVESRRLGETLRNSEYFVVRYSPESAAEAEALLFSDRAATVIIIPEGFSRAVIRGETATIQMLVDGSNGVIASAVLGYLQNIVVSFGGDLVPVNQEPASPVRFDPRVWFNPELESSHFLIPGLVAFILIITAVVSTALSVVREKELGTLEQLAVSPLRPIELIIGKTIPYTVISLVVAATVFVSASILFGVKCAGSYWWLSAVTVLFLFACIGFGVMISSIADTQQVAFLMAIMITFLPSFILSGFVFPIANMPPIIQVVTYIIPARYYISALRAIMLRGAGIEFFWQDVVLLAVFAAGTIIIGVQRLRKESVLA